MADAFKSLQSSGFTLAAFNKFAKASPKKAEQYLTSLEQNLRKTGAAKEANALKKLIDADGPFSDRLAKHTAALASLFPKTKTEWGKVQLERETTLQYGVTRFVNETFHYPNQKKATQAPLALTGTIALPKPKKGTWENPPPTFTTNGKTYVLADSSRDISMTGLPSALVTGFVGDGPVTVKGVVSEDGKSLHVESFALNVDGEYDDQVTGRVRDRVPGQPLFIDTARGPVEIVNERLAKKLAALPRLGIILPGGTEQEGERTVYRKSPSEFFALAKWNAWGTEKAKNGNEVKTADMAFSFFENKPIEYPPELSKRAESSIGRFWAKGNVTVREGNATRFVASYLSNSVDDRQLANSGVEADAVQAAVTMTSPTVAAPKKR